MLLLGLLLTVSCGLAAYAATSLVRRHAPRLGVVATPNARSSHSQPTPSGGGLGIVFGGTMAAGFAAWFSPWPLLAVLIASLAIAAIGFVDDRQPVPAPLRLGAQLLLLAFVVLAGPPLPLLPSSLGTPLPEVLLVAFVVLCGTYWINLFNFMDGIDGLAASQSVFMLLGAALLAWLAVPAAATHPGFWWMLGLAAAAAGFLLLNWPPARIFMGDAGSTYLGFLLAYLALATIGLGWLTLWQWLILGAAFITDATVTLTRRLLLRERVFEAHRRHAYQVVSRRWKSHRRVTLSFVAVNLLWLLPLAWLAGMAGALAPAVAVLAYAPLVALALRLGAGAPEAVSGA